MDPPGVGRTRRSFSLIAHEGPSPGAVAAAHVTLAGDDVQLAADLGVEPVLRLELVERHLHDPSSAAVRPTATHLPVRSGAALEQRHPAPAHALWRLRLHLAVVERHGDADR